MDKQAENLIILIDDDKQLLKTLGDILDYKGFSSISADTGKKGLELAKEYLPDLAIIDIKLEDMSGLEVLREIKKIGPDTECILLTGFATQKTAIEAINQGAFSYLQKPYDIEHLILTIKQALGKQQTAKSLRESERKHSALLSNIPGAAYRRSNNKDWKMDFVSDGFKVLTGYEPKELTRAGDISYFDLIHPEDHESVASVLKESIEKRIPYQLEYRLSTAGGKEKWVWDKGRVIQADSSGQEVLEGIILDIDDRKLSENQLHRYEHIVSSSTDMLALMDKNFNFLATNPAYSAAFGLTREEITGKNIKEIFGDEIFKNRIKPNGLRCMQGEEVNFQTEMVFPVLGKRHLDITYYPYLDMNGEIDGFVVNSRDISERKKASMAWHASEAKFQALFEESPDVIFLTTPDGKLQDLNQAGLDVFGLSKEEISGFNVEKWYLKKSDFETVKNTIEKAGHASGIEVKLINKDEVPVSFTQSSVMRRISEDQVLVQTILHDISEQVLARQKINEALEKAQEGEKVKTLFLANMSHEIRTPLNSIIGFSQILSDSMNFDQNAEESEFVNIIAQSSERLLRTVNEILEISTMEAGTYAVKPEKFELVSLVQSLADQFQIQSRGKGLDLKFETDFRQLYVNYDIYCLTQAITNLVDNAIKYTDKGGVEISLKRHEKKLVLKISDTGIGMSKAYINNMYEAFSQESSGYTKKYQGIGLGLALTKRYLELNNILVSVESKQKSGTVFTVTMDEVPGELDSIADEKNILPPKSAKSLTVGSHTILALEDDLYSQSLISTILKDEYHLEFAVSVPEAIKILRSKNISLVLLDLSLEGDEDGLDFVRYLRGYSKSMAIPVIATTAHAYPADRDTCMTAGCNEFLAKPLDSEKLNEMINLFLHSPD